MSIQLQIIARLEVQLKQQLLAPVRNKRWLEHAAHETVSVWKHLWVLFDTLFLVLVVQNDDEFLNDLSLFLLVQPCNYFLVGKLLGRLDI